MPLPYSNGCIITYEGAENPFYFAINHRNYDPGTSVQTFTMADLTTHAAKIDSVEAELENNTADVTAGTTLVADGNTDILAGQTSSYTINVGSAQAIRQIRAKIEADDTKQALRSTVIEIEFDGVSKVWAPLGDFFCAGYQIGQEFEGRYHKLTHDGFMLSRWIMPFQTSAEITIHNYGSQTVTLETLEINHSAWTWDARSLYFHTGWHNETNIATLPRRDTNYVEIEGRGKYVGDSLAIYNDYAGGGNPWWGEGDEKIYVDGEAFPSHFGTGTEDYYGYAWVGCANFSQPFLAQPIAQGNRSQGLSVNNRWRILDTITFDTSLKLDMEIFHWNSTNLDYAPTTFWYGEAVTREVVDLDAATVVNFPKDITGAQNSVRFMDIHEGEELMIVDNPNVDSVPYTRPNNTDWSNRTALLVSDLDADEALTASFYSDKARSGILTITGTKTSGTTTVEMELNGNVIVSDFTGTVSVAGTDLVQGSNTLIIRGLAASGNDAVIELDKLAIDDSGAGLAIMGTNNAIDSTLGNASTQFGAPERLNDGASGVDGDNSFVDTTFGGDDTAPAYGYVGLLNLDTSSKLVTSVSLQLACFFDGGWFGPNNATPGPGGGLANPTHLTVPTVQITTDNGTTWTNTTSTSNNYLSVMSGAQIGINGGTNPRYYTISFPLDTPQTGINGIRLIGLEGGTADAGFIAAAEFEIQTAPPSAPAEVVNVHSGALADTTTAAIDSSDWAIGETWYFKYTNDGPSNGNGVVSGIAIDDAGGEKVFLGDGSGSGTPWVVTGNPNQSSAAQTLDGSTFTIVIGITRGATTDANTYNFYVNPDLFDSEENNSADISGTLNNFDPSQLTQVRSVTNEAVVRDIFMYTNGATPFDQVLPNTYTNWIEGYSVGDLTDIDDDFDLDGLGNGLENFLGTDPSIYNAGLAGLTTDGSSTSFTHQQNPAPADDLIANYEWSLDLTKWNDSGDTFNGTTVTINAALNTPSTGTTTATAAEFGTATDELFLRLTVKEVAP